MEAILTGDPVTAERAHDLGMVNELVEPGQARDAAVALSERICANAPLAVRASRSVVAAADTEDDETLWRRSEAAFARVANSEDFAEGPRAFIEKRQPQWKGR
jgi:enoyl-CoA hydratase/carnithine racemase